MIRHHHGLRRGGTFVAALATIFGLSACHPAPAKTAQELPQLEVPGAPSPKAERASDPGRDFPEVPPTGEGRTSPAVVRHPFMSGGGLCAAEREDLAMGFFSIDLPPTGTGSIEERWLLRAWWERSLRSAFSSAGKAAESLYIEAFDSPTCAGALLCGHVTRDSIATGNQALAQTLKSPPAADFYEAKLEAAETFAELGQRALFTQDVALFELLSEPRGARFLAREELAISALGFSMGAGRLQRLELNSMTQWAKSLAGRVHVTFAIPGPVKELVAAWNPLVESGAATKTPLSSVPQGPSPQLQGAAVHDTAVHDTAHVSVTDENVNQSALFVTMPRDLAPQAAELQLRLFLDQFELPQGVRAVMIQAADLWGVPVLALHGDYEDLAELSEHLRDSTPAEGAANHGQAIILEKPAPRLIEARCQKASPRKTAPPLEGPSAPGLVVLWGSPTAPADERAP